MKKAYLIGRSGIYADARIEVDGEVVIGRDAQVCQLVYPKSEKKISGVHCKVQKLNDTYCVVDMSSTNGTFFQDGTKLAPNSPRTLQDGQGFYLGSRENFFDIHITEVSEQKPKKKRGGVGIVIAVFLILILLGVAGVLGYSYYQEVNKSTIDKAIDTFDSFQDDADGILDLVDDIFSW